MKRLLKYNAVALIALYGVWIWGWYMSEYWMDVIDFCVPWSWFTVFFLSSSFARRKQVSPIKFVVGSLAGAFGTWMAFCILWFFSMPFFDPYW
jgi:hypothetical protein